MGTDSPLLPLVGASVGLLALVAVLIFVVLKLRTAGREASQTGRDRLSEEAFAAATIKAALANRPAPVIASPAAAPTPAVTAGADTVDAAVLEALPVGLIVTDEAGVIRRCTAPARDWLGIAGPGTGHPFRATLRQWPAIADGLASAHAGDAPAPFMVLTESAAAPSPRLTVAITRWTPRGARGGAVAVVSTAILGPPAPGVAEAPPTPDTADASRLASGLAHELANSLTTVHGYAHLVDRSVLSAADRSALDHITSSSEKMLTTVEAFRALVRPLPITPTTFAPADAVQAAIALARQEANLPDAVVQFSSAPSGTVHGDQVLLEEAVAAVIRNAIEASAQMSPAPPVEVSVAQVPGERRVVIVVTDRGPGVPDDVRARVFQPFITDKPGHSGLGLARASQVLRAHAGASIALAHPATGGLVVTIGLPQHA
jgi:signal transduction histidine kinase